jgi:hypothetical protein
MVVSVVIREHISKKFNYSNKKYANSGDFTYNQL